MNFENLTLGEIVKVECVLLVLESMYLGPYLIEGADDVVDYFLSTSDDKIIDQAQRINKKLVKIQDDNFLNAVGNHISPVCGNYYCYVAKVVLEGVLSKIDLEGHSELVFSNIVSASFENSWGEMICMEL